MNKVCYYWHLFSGYKQHDIKRHRYPEHYSYDYRREFE